MISPGVASSKKAEPEDGPQATSSSISQVFSPSYLDSYPLLSMASKAPIEKRHGKQPNRGASEREEAGQDRRA